MDQRDEFVRVATDGRFRYIRYDPSYTVFGGVPRAGGASGIAFGGGFSRAPWALAHASRKMALDVFVFLGDTWPICA